MAHELVTLIQKVNDLELALRDTENAWTESQAREAIVEAECNSVKALLIRSTETLNAEQNKVNELESQLNALKLSKNELEVKFSGSNALAGEQKMSTQNLIHAKESLLRRSREVLEDWAIISRLAMEQFSLHCSCWSQLQTNIDISFETILQIDPETFPEEMDMFLPAMIELTKQTYEKIMAISRIKPKDIVSGLISQMECTKKELLQRISFQR